MTESLLDRYERVTTEALAVAEQASVADAERTAIVLEMVRAYVSDARHFRAKGDMERALAALSYAHGWLDCAARMRFFIVTDERLFTVDAREHS